jgi:5-methylcytosine-specific restriction endonuclease McrA
MRAEFTRETKLAAYRRSLGRCEKCGALFGGRRPTYDHIKPCEFGGDNSLQNCQVLCPACDGEKTYKHDIPAIAKSNRIRNAHAGLRRDRTIRAWRKFDGTPVFKPRER